MIATTVTGFCTFSSAWKSGNFLHILGPFHYKYTKLHSKPGEKGKQSNGENSKKSSAETSPKLQISVPCRGRTCPDNRGRKAHPKSRNTKKIPRSRELFQKVCVNFCLLPCDTSQEPNGNCYEKLVQMNFFILGGFFRVDFPPLKENVISLIFLVIPQSSSIFPRSFLDLEIRTMGFEGGDHCVRPMARFGTEPPQRGRKIGAAQKLV